MAKTDWQMGDTVQPEDMNQIGQEINQLREDVDNIEVPPASTEQAGIVQLSNAIDSISETMAATPKAVKQAYDQAVQAFQLGNEKKQDLVDALIAIGVPASTSESWDDLLGKVASVIRATGDAAVGDVLAGKTFSNASANGLTGTMPNRGAVNPNLTNQGQQYTIPAGYHNGAGKVTANISNLTAGNVRSGATVGGVAGTFSQFSNGATAAQILTGRSAAVNGVVVNGTMPNRSGHVTGQSISHTGTTLRIRPQAGFYPGGTDNSVQYNEPNWVSENILEGVTMFGKLGTAKGLPGFIPAIVPYKSGQEYAQIDQGYSESTGSQSKQSDRLYLEITTNNNVRSERTFVISNSVNLDDKAYVGIIYENLIKSVNTGIVNLRVMVSENKNTSYDDGDVHSTVAATTTSSDGRLYVDVSGLQGQYYIRVHLYGLAGSQVSGSVGITQIALI